MIKSYYCNPKSTKYHLCSVSKLFTLVLRDQREYSVELSLYLKENFLINCNLVESMPFDAAECASALSALLSTWNTVFKFSVQYIGSSLDEQQLSPEERAEREPEVRARTFPLSWIQIFNPLKRSRPHECSSVYQILDGLDV